MLRTFIVIALIYVTVIGTFLLIGNYYLQQQEFERRNEAIFNDRYNYTNTRISSVRELSYIICSSEQTKLFMTELGVSPNQYNRLQLSKLIRNLNTLSITGNSSILITKIYDNYAITDSSTGQLDYLLKHMAIPRKEFDTVIEGLPISYGVEIQVIKNEISSKLTTYHFISRQLVNGMYPLYICVTYEEDKLFQPMVLDQTEFILLKDEEIITSTGNMSQNQIQNIMENKNSQYLIFNKASDIKGYTYIMLAKRPGFMDSSLLLVISFSIFMLVLSILLMFHITKKMYDPIAQTIASTVGTDDYFTDEFTSIQQSFWQLQSNVEKMEQYYKSAENQFFYDLLSGLVPREEVADKLKEFGITQIPGEYMVVLIRFNIIQNSNPDSLRDLLHLTRCSLLNGIKDTTSLYRVIDINLILQAFIFRNEDMNHLTGELRSVCLNVEPDSGIEITAYVGGLSNSLQDISSSFLQASYLASQTEYAASYNKVIIYSDTEVNSQHNYNAYYPISVEQAIISAVINGKATVWKNALMNLIQTNQMKSPGNPNHLSHMLSTTISRIISVSNEEASSVFGNHTYINKAFRGCISYDDLLEKAIESITRLADYLNQKAQSSSISTGIKMTDFIHQNYTRDISLYDLADHMNMSKNYTSSLFKETTGHNFKEYLSEFRMNKARLLMKEKNGRIKVQEVAAAVGCNTDSLLRLFINYEGITPSEYLRKIIEGEKD